MLSLDDPGWQQLRHAYGEASDVPDMLRTLALSPEPLADRRAEPWHGLWSSLCHQGGVYTASYAALPHIVRIACETRAAIDFSFFLLPAAIEVARVTGRGPSLPAQQADAYRRGVARLAEAASSHHHAPWDRTMLQSVLAAQAAAKGHIDVAEALMNLDDDWITRINSGDLD